MTHQSSLPCFLLDLLTKPERRVLSYAAPFQPI
jgi:hypothetical protein